MTNPEMFSLLTFLTYQMVGLQSFSLAVVTVLRKNFLEKLLG